MNKSPLSSTGRARPDHRVVILGAGKSVRSSLPSAMVHVDQDRRVLDWLLNAFRCFPSSDVVFVGGYMADTVIDQYPDIRFVYNPAWETTGPVKSLSMAPLTSNKATYVSYSDIVFRDTAVDALESIDADVVLAVDSQWQIRFEGRSAAELESAEKVAHKGRLLNAIGKELDTRSATAEFAGLLKLSGTAADQVDEILDSGVVDGNVGLPSLIQHLIDINLSVEVVDVAGDWAELNAPQDLARFVLGTKAESLDRLKPLLRGGVIGDLVMFTHAQWTTSCRDVLKEVQKTFVDTQLIARSSALSEDNWLHSAAGSYESIAHVSSRDPYEITNAIDKVLRSYGDPIPENQVLVQEMITDVTISGVVMTRTSSLSAPYYVINFDDTTHRTDTVTAGTGRNIRTVFLHRESKQTNGIPHELHRLLDVVTELEQLVGHDSLDIEFAITSDERVHVLQLRPIVVHDFCQAVNDDTVAAALEDAERFLVELQSPTPFLVGRSTQLSVMSDWNPAEIIGVKPNRLSFSLYRYLITDDVWAQQRAEYGYRDVRPCNLIIDLLGHPYVDIRATFNSFIPAALPNELAERLLAHYLDHLRRHPELHDKVEFDVLFTCTMFDFNDRAIHLREAGFRDKEIDALRLSLLNLTRMGIERIDRDYADIAILKQRFSCIRESDLALLDKAFLYLEDVKRFGTPAFSHLARNGFVAVTLLRSLVATGTLTPSQLDVFLASLKTVSSDIQNDACHVSNNRVTWETFLDTYGHLRPGTYDITSPRYDHAAGKFLQSIVGQEFPISDRPSIGWDTRTRNAIADQLDGVGLDPDVDYFERFARQAIEGREYGKFVFTRNLSAALECLADFGTSYDISRQDLAHIRIGDLLGLRSATGLNIATQLKSLAHAGKQAFALTQSICLPSQVLQVADLRCFEQLVSDPNFVTQKTVRAELTCLSLYSVPSGDIDGKIVLIPNADPGFDWIFCRQIAGLITMYGGANSHMAIRSAEFELPAAIGIGSLLFEELQTATLVELDCATRRIRILQ